MSAESRNVWRIDPSYRDFMTDIHQASGY